MENTEMDDLGDNTVDPVGQTTDQTTDQETSFGGDDLLHTDGDIHDLSIAVPTGFAPSTDIAQLGDDDDRFADLEDQQTAKEILKGDILESVLGFRPKAAYGEWSRKLLLEGVEPNRGTGRDKGVIGLKSGGKVVIKKRPAEDGGGFMWSESADNVVALKISKLKNTIVKAKEEYEAVSFPADISRRVDADVDPGASTSREGLATEAVTGEIVGSVQEEVVERIRTTRDDIERESGELRIPYSEFREVRGGLDLAILRQVGMKFSERMESLDKDIKHWEEKAEGEADPQKKRLYESVVRVEMLTKDYIRIRNGLKPLSDEVLDIVKEVVGGSDELRLERFRRWAKKNMVGISAMAIWGAENARKLMSEDDSAVSSNAHDNIIKDVYDGRVWIKLGRILNDYGVYPTVGNLRSVRYTITLPRADEIMVPQSGETAGYSLEDIKYEFRGLRSKNLFENAMNYYNVGRSLVYDDVSFFKRLHCDKDDTLHNIDINVPRKKIKSIVLMFRKKDYTDSEEFIFPKITNVRVTHGSIPNYIYSDGMSKSNMFREADGVFRNNVDYTMSETKFFADKFALVLDLRSSKDNEVYGSGAKVDGTSSGIKLAITKEAMTEDILCYVYIISSSIVNISDSRFQNIER